MAINRGANLPKKGMNRNQHPSEISNKEYSFAYNSNIKDSGSNGNIILQNEPSNTKCSSFKEGFFVIGNKRDNITGRTYYFLTNPTTGCSEIGYTDEKYEDNGLTASVTTCGCNQVADEDTPLQDVEQQDTCSYITVVSDFCERAGGCTRCLNFDINYPIKEENIEIKHETTGVTLYWTDRGLNPPRFLQLGNLNQYYEEREEDCGDIAETCFQCDKLRIFKNTGIPCFKTQAIQNGGALPAGVIEITGSYCTEDGIELTDYYSLTNPVTIFDKTNNILDQTSLDYMTNQAILVTAENIDKNYEFVKLVVIYRSGLDGAVTYYQYGVYPTSTKSYTITSLKNLDTTDLQTILNKRPKYLKSNGLTANNGILFHFGLTQHREYNLQPVVNLMGSLARWMTYEGEEDLFENGVFVANYQHYMRDEVEPFGIYFESEDGYETTVFPFIARPAKTKEIEILGTTAFPEDPNNLSILENAPNCSINNRRYRWQFENTATVLDNCPPTYTDNTVTSTEKLQVSCEVSGTVESIVGPESFTTDGQILNIIDWINSNPLDLNSTQPGIIVIKNAIDTTYPDHCTPDFPSGCTSITLTEETVFAKDVATFSSIKQDALFSDYERPAAPTSCNTYTTDSSGNLVNDTSFVSSYMEPSEVVYQRVSPITNTSCVTASTLSTLTFPQISNGNYLPYSGAASVAALQTTINVALTDTSVPGYAFTNKLHKNAIWFKGSFGSDAKKTFEISPNFCQYTDDNSFNKVRLTFYNDCSDTSSISVYDTIVHDISLYNDPNKMVLLDATDFPSGNFYVAIDAPIRTRTLTSSAVVHTITPPCGCFSVYQRDAEHVYENTYTGLSFGKREVYEADCPVTNTLLKGCEPVPYEYGLFSYVESTRTYPCNPELWDSSVLVISPEDLPLDYQAEFESYYTTGLNPDGTYVLSSETNFQNKGIRHFKFPDSTVSPYMSTSFPGSFMPSKIYPIGFFLSNDVINSFLDVAVNNGLITLQERQKIVSYKIVRGDRSTQRSVLAKGILFDTYKYQVDGTTIHYPNYPLNALGSDKRNDVLNHPYSSQKNTRFTFHSPDYHFNKNYGVGREMNVEGYVFGKSANYFDEVKDHATFVLLTDKARQLASTLAAVEVALEVLIQATDFFITASSGGAQPGTAAAIIAAVAVGVTLAIQVGFKAGQYRYQWLQTFHNLGTPRNFAYYQVSVGYYNYFVKNTVTNSRYRGLASATYLKEGRWEVADEINSTLYTINNFTREDSVFVNTGKDAYAINYPSTYQNYDNELSNQILSSRASYLGIGASEKLVRNAASPYVSIKQYLPDQYGDINDVSWILTGYCGNLVETNECKPAFGGDTVISRFSLKRKFPFFTATAHGAAPLIPFKYSEYFNINPDSVGTFRLYVDHLVTDDTESIAGYLFPDIKSKYNMEASVTLPNQMYVTPPSKFYLYSYGIPHFLVESTINCNYRYAKKERHENFYPNIKDVIEFTQESNVSIREPNTYFYNFVYSAPHTKTGRFSLPTTYSEELYNKLTYLPNLTAYSRKDASETSITDPWLNYRANDVFQFPSEYGQLISMTPLESEQILARFETGFGIFNAVDNLADRITKDTYQLGTGGVFAGRSVQFNKTELGYAGTQNTNKISTSFGHVWADAKRGKVFMLGPNATGLKELSGDISNWLKEHLPFKMLKYFSDVNVDNNYNGIGITFGWDDRTKRVFITKKDYIPVGQICHNAGHYYDISDKEVIIAQYEEANNTLINDDGCKLTFENNETRSQTLYRFPEVRLEDETHFIDASWTLAFNTEIDGWISYYGFKPNYYVSHNEYFDTGVNSTNSKKGLWNHYPHTSSYNVFYGELQPWIVEHTIQSQLMRSNLQEIEYWMDVRKYYNKYDSADITGVSFNKVWVYNNFQNTGNLFLSLQETNNRFQQLQYPKFNPDSIEILQAEIEGKHSFNYLFNSVRNEKAHLPLWKYDVNEIHKEVDDTLIDYRNTRKNRLRGDYFVVRYQQDIESRYKMLFRFTTDTRDFKQ